MSPGRIRARGCDLLAPDERVPFTWDGDETQGRPGEPIAVSLWRAGIRTQTRSIKYHRARGPQCFTGDCPGCLVRVDGVPNQRGCRTPVEEGLEVQSQVGRPTAKRDLLSVVDWLLPRFDHERDFVRPAPVRNTYEAIARHLAGFGKAPSRIPRYGQGEALTTDVLVVGAGPAGLAAATEAARGGADVLLVDPDDPGGSLLHTPTPVQAGQLGARPGPELAQALTDELPDRVQRLQGHVYGLYPEGAALVEHHPDGDRAHTVQARATVLCTGAHEGAHLVPGNDRPGVLGARAARILLNRWGVPPGARVVVADPQREGDRFAGEAQDQGLDVTRVEGLEEVGGDPEVTWARAGDQRVPADCVVLDPGLSPTVELAQQAGLPLAWVQELGGRVPLHRPDGTTPLDDVFVAGGVAGVHEPGAALAQGRLAGARAAGADPPLEPHALRKLLGSRDQAALESVWEERP